MSGTKLGVIKKKLGLRGKTKPGEMVKRYNDIKSGKVKMAKATKKPKLGTGARFRQLTSKLASKGAKNPKALAAYIGRKKFGAKKFAKLSAKGKK